jgi:PiT family inorganic phosphate transporter
MLAHLEPSSWPIILLLAACLLLALAFEATNGFHDTANAVATVIYTNSLPATAAVVWSGIMNFLGVAVAGIAVAYALVELLPPDVLSPPNGAPAVPTLIALFSVALFWNLATWALGIPNSSSHCIIGALIGIAIGNALLNARSLGEGVDWSQVWKVLSALALSPILGLVGAGLLYRLLRLLVKDRHLYQPPEGDKPPVWWMRAILILTCTGVSFAHGSNDGQKSIGLIMLAMIGLMPASFALNPEAHDQLAQLGTVAAQATPLIERYGDDEKQLALDAARDLQARVKPSGIISDADPGEPAAASAGPNPEARTRSAIRNDVYRIMSELEIVGRSKAADEATEAEAERLRKTIGPTVAYAPWWVRILSALCLGIGTMVGYRRIVTTLGERLGTTHLTPAQGGSAELVSAVLIGTAGFTGLPVSTTHVVTAGIAGTMLGSGAGLQPQTVIRIILAWVLTLPVTILLSAGLFYLLESPHL